MNSILIKKSKLNGNVKVSGAKNSALRLLAASLLTDEKIELFNFPNDLLDVKIHIKMLEKLGKKIVQSKGLIIIDEIHDQVKTELYWDDRSIRNTLLIMGAQTTRLGRSMIPLPGGCNLGDRKYDLHIMILEKLGAKIWQEENYLFSEAKDGLKGTDIYLPLRSTGATENAIISGTLAKGKTTIWNPHIRPEIIDLISFLNSMGAKIRVFGQQRIEIDGVKKLSRTRHTVIPDNMEAITWAIGSVITDGDVEIVNFPFEDLEVPLIFLRESGMKFYKGDNSLIVRGGKPYPIEISTGPYPGINSDMQPLFAVYGAMAEGKSKIIDLRFPGRYAYADQMARMGLDYKIDGEMLLINGGKKLIGAEVEAVDLRAGISLLLAGLVAEGETTIKNAWQIDRGYENLESKLINLGVSSFKIS